MGKVVCLNCICYYKLLMPIPHAMVFCHLPPLLTIIWYLDALLSIASIIWKKGSKMAKKMPKIWIYYWWRKIAEKTKLRTVYTIIGKNISLIVKIIIIAFSWNVKAKNHKIWKQFLNKYHADLKIIFSFIISSSWWKYTDHVAQSCWPKSILFVVKAQSICKTKH